MTGNLRADIEALRAEIDWSVKDYRVIFPEPFALAPNLGLAVRALAILDAHPAEESAGVDLIAAERTRQVEAEGYTADHDAGHADELSLAAACYALTPNTRGTIVHFRWPWESRFWKPTPDRVRELVKAGALIAAAIDAHLAALGVPVTGEVSS